MGREPLVALRVVMPKPSALFILAFAVKDPPWSDDNRVGIPNCRITSCKAVSPSVLPPALVRTYVLPPSSPVGSREAGFIGKHLRS